MTGESRRRELDGEAWGGYGFYTEEVQAKCARKKAECKELNKSPKATSTLSSLPVDELSRYSI